MVSVFDTGGYNLGGSGNIFALSEKESGMSVTARPRAKSNRAGFVHPELQAELGRLREIDTHPKLSWLAIEYATLAVIVTLTIGFAELRAGWGLTWAWNLPVFAIAVALIGGVQHRLAGLGHEASAL